MRRIRTSLHAREKEAEAGCPSLLRVMGTVMGMGMLMGMASDYASRPYIGKRAAWRWTCCVVNVEKEIYR